MCQLPPPRVDAVSLSRWPNWPATPPPRSRLSLMNLARMSAIWAPAHSRCHAGSTHQPQDPIASISPISRAWRGAAAAKITESGPGRWSANHVRLVLPSFLPSRPLLTPLQTIVVSAREEAAVGESHHRELSVLGVGLGRLPSSGKAVCALNSSRTPPEHV
jgi:hypothetical protein